MPQQTTEKFVRVPRTEYAKLKELELRFAAFLAYAEHVSAIREARREVRSGKTVLQKKVFERLGL